MSIFRRLSQRVFCRTRTLAELLDRQRSRMGRLAVSGIVMTPRTPKDEDRMKTLIIIAMFVTLCAVSAGSLTQTAFHALTESGCDVALAERQAAHAETMRALNHMERFVGGWGSTKP